ncbi:MAG TPA: hypothetical protein VFH58_04995 [Acidimicrobiales bacterium]|nr:hypothetical protein [Acidimicrobiales bacterium]
MVLLLLALIWGALLISWLRSRSATGFSDSVGTFRRHLNVLERTTPTTVRPANRLVDPASRYTAGPTPSFSTGSAVRRTRPVAANAAALRRRQSQKRRRDVFFALLAGTVGFFALALLPGMSILWSVQVLFDILLGSYVAILVNLRNRAAEREMKLRYMASARQAPRPRRTYDFGAAGYGDLELRRAAN